MKNLLKLGQGPRPDLLFEEEEKAKKSDTQPDGQKQKIEFEKGLRTVRKEAKKKAREEKKKQEPIEMSRKDKLAVILAFCELLLPLAIGVMAIFCISYLVFRKILAACMVNGKREYKRGQALPWEVLFILYEKLQPVCMEIEFPKENQKEKPDNCTKKETRNGTARMDFYN